MNYMEPKRISFAVLPNGNYMLWCNYENEIWEREWIGQMPNCAVLFGGNNMEKLHRHEENLWERFPMAETRRVDRWDFSCPLPKEWISDDTIVQTQDGNYRKIAVRMS